MKKHILSILTALTLAGGAIAAAEAPKYIFYYIGDGMGMGPIMAAESYWREIRGEEKPLNMMQMSVAGWTRTFSASSPVTDSAAAGTALSTGSKTRNGMLGQDADSLDVTSVARICKDRGMGVGVLTSVAADDATPGAFYAHVPYRKMFYDIDCALAASGYDFVGGAGIQGTSDKDGAPTDVASRLASEKVQVLYGPGAIDSIGDGRVLLLNYEGSRPWNVGYTIDSIGSQTLNLPQMTRTCLAHLEKRAPQGFFMMVEGGNIDHALHGNDGGAAIKEILNFDEAIGVAFDFYLAHPDETLILVTADHDTGGMSLGNRALHYEAKLGLFDAQRISKEEFSELCKGLLKSRRNYTWDDMKEILTEKLGFFTVVPVSAEQETGLREQFEKTFHERNSKDQETLYASFNAFAVDVFRILNDAAGVGFTTTSHTGNPVPVFAVGVGADRFKGFNNNTDLPRHILDILNGKDL
ncbi:MAG: alkaline phosphatase [Muribaculaceae bacterium]|nr:alkaline phosphatase [Muribaculaceae bacterium]